MSKKEEKEVIEITDEYSLTKTTTGVTLYFRSREESTKMVKGVSKICRVTATMFYGTLYQALQGFVEDYTERHFNSVHNIVATATDAMEALDSLYDKIADDWKIVKVVKG